MVLLKEEWQEAYGFRKHAFTAVSYLCLENIFVFIVPLETVEWKSKKVGKL